MKTAQAFILLLCGIAALPVFAGKVQQPALNYSISLPHIGSPQVDQIFYHLSPNNQIPSSILGGHENSANFLSSLRSHEFSTATLQRAEPSQVFIFKGQTLFKSKKFRPLLEPDFWNLEKNLQVLNSFLPQGGSIQHGQSGQFQLKMPNPISTEDFVCNYQQKAITKASNPKDYEYYRQISLHINTAPFDTPTLIIIQNCSDFNATFTQNIQITYFYETQDPTQFVNISYSNVYVKTSFVKTLSTSVIGFFTNLAGGVDANMADSLYKEFEKVRKNIKAHLAD